MCATATEVEATNAAGSAGVKAALSWWLPAARAVVSRRATPSATAAVPRAVPPSRNSTVPAAAGATVAVSVTDAPAADVPAGAATSVVVVACAGATGSGDTTRAVRVDRGLPAYDEKYGETFPSVPTTLPSATNVTSSPARVADTVTSATFTSSPPQG